MVVCICKRTRSEDIDAAIDRGASSMSEVALACGGAGTGCGRCRPIIHDRLAERGAGCTGDCADCPGRQLQMAG